MKEKVKKIITKQPTNLIDISNQLECGMKEVVEVINEMINEGLNIVEEPLNTFHLCKTITYSENKYQENWKGDKIIRFGAVSDSRYDIAHIICKLAYRKQLPKSRSERFLESLIRISEDKDYISKLHTLI